MYKNLKDILSEETIKNLKEVSQIMFNNLIWFGEAYAKIDRDGKITIPNNTEIEEIKKIN